MLVYLGVALLTEIGNVYELPTYKRASHTTHGTVLSTEVQECATYLYFPFSTCFTARTRTASVHHAVLCLLCVDTSYHVDESAFVGGLFGVAGFESLSDFCGKGSLLRSSKCGFEKHVHKRVRTGGEVAEQADACGYLIRERALQGFIGRMAGTGALYLVWLAVRYWLMPNHHF